MDQHGLEPHTFGRRMPVIRDFVIFQLKLLLDGMKDVLAIKLSIVAIVIDIITGHRRDPKFFYLVVRGSRRFENWLGLHRLKGLAERDSRIDAPSFESGIPDADALLSSAEDLVDRINSTRSRNRM